MDDTHNPRTGFATIGNATLVFYDDGRPVLATDPWLHGTCYFGSWTLDHPLSRHEFDAVLAAEYIWISHGHPDHLHQELVDLLPRSRNILLPDHYHPEIRDLLIEKGFSVKVLRYRKWYRLGPHLRCLCLDNENQDGILIVEAGDALIVNLNDSPLCGEGRFIRRLVSEYDKSKTYLARLCAIDADMLNFVDEHGQRAIDAPERYKPGMVWATARLAAYLRVGNYVCSSSQHLYARTDSIWANAYRISWSDIRQHWHRPAIRILEPFISVDLATGAYHRKHSSQSSDESVISFGTGQDNYAETLTDDDWLKVSAFFRKFDLLRPHFDYLEFAVGGERRRFWISERRRSRRLAALRGIAFHVPRASLLEAVGSGYFDDLLIGNFMKTELHNAKLYPHFTPVVAKLGGNAKVFTRADRARFNRRYLRRNPVGYIEWRLQQRAEEWLDTARAVAGRLGIKRPLKRVYRKLIGDPVS